MINEQKKGEQTKGSQQQEQGKEPRNPQRGNMPNEQNRTTEGGAGKHEQVKGQQPDPNRK